MFIMQHLYSPKYECLFQKNHYYESVLMAQHFDSIFLSAAFTGHFETHCSMEFRYFLQLFWLLHFRYPELFTESSQGTFDRLVHQTSHSQWILLCLCTKYNQCQYTATELLLVFNIWHAIVNFSYLVYNFLKTDFGILISLVTNSRTKMFVW